MKVALIPQDGSLAQILQGDCVDITGQVFDWGIAFSCYPTLEECRDYYDKIMYLFGCNIKLIKLVPNWFSWTTIEQFIVDHRKVFEKFMEKTYKEEYIYDWNTISNDSEEFYDVFLNLMEDLIAGRACEEDYKILWNLFMEEEKIMDNNFYVMDDDTNEILTGPLSEQSAEDFVDEHVNCHVVYLEKY